MNDCFFEKRSHNLLIIFLAVLAFFFLMFGMFAFSVIAFDDAERNLTSTQREQIALLRSSVANDYLKGETK